MEIINIFIFFLSVFGAATIISSEYIFSKVIDKFNKYDKLYYLLTCNKCMSFWIGLLVSFLGFKIINPFLDACAAYTVTCLLNCVLFGREDENGTTGDS